MQPMTSLVIGTIFEHDTRPVDDRRRMIHEWRSARRHHLGRPDRSSREHADDLVGVPAARGDVRA